MVDPGGKFGEVPLKINHDAHWSGPIFSNSAPILNLSFSQFMTYEFVQCWQTFREKEGKIRAVRVMLTSFGNTGVSGENQWFCLRLYFICNEKLKTLLRYCWKVPKELYNYGSVKKRLEILVMCFGTSFDCPTNSSCESTTEINPDSDYCADCKMISDQGLLPVRFMFSHGRHVV